MSRPRTVWIGWIAAVLCSAGFARLGAWQLDRMHQKQAMLDAVHAVLAQRHAVPLAHADDRARAGDYDWAAGNGRFASAPTVLLDNQSRDDRAGVRAYRLFLPDEGSTPLLVDLGWLPMSPERRVQAVTVPAGELRIDGLLSSPPSRGLLAATLQRQVDGSVLATGLDAPGLAKELGHDAIAPRVLRLDPAASFGYARDLDILPNTLPPERHMGYAVQWFALALAVLVTALVVSLRARRKPATAVTQGVPHERH